MAYMNQDKKKVIAAAIKPILEWYGLKGTLSTCRHSITLTLKSGKMDLMKTVNAAYKMSRHYRDGDPEFVESQVNPYHLSDTFKGEQLKAMRELVDALKAAEWFDKSDIQLIRF